MNSEAESDPKICPKRFFRNASNNTLSNQDTNVQQIFGGDITSRITITPVISVVSEVARVIEELELENVVPEQPELQHDPLRPGGSSRIVFVKSPVERS